VPDEYEVRFSEDLAVFTRRDGALVTALEVLISAEDDAEVRRVSISNTGVRARHCEVTSYSEIVLARPDADLAHPAFSKLFVETEYLESVGAIVATRRRRSPAEPEVWAAHLAVVDADVVDKPEIETDRARFLGRGHGIRTAAAIAGGQALSNTVGAVLDPIFALRRRVRIAPGATVSVAFWTLVASTHKALLDSVDKRRDTTAFGPRRP
jgi:cyclic beta-1,2-glucan synthetase